MSGGILAFEGFNLKGILKKLKDNPERAFIGAADPFSSKVWGKVLGKDYSPMVDQMGGATQQTYKDAEAAGIDTSAGKGMHNIAHVIAAAYAGGYGMSQLGAAGGAGAGGAAGGGSGGGAVLGSADKAAMFGNAGYGEGMTGAQTSAFDGALGGGGMDFDFPGMGGSSQERERPDVVKPLEVTFDADGNPLITSSREAKTPTDAAGQAIDSGVAGANLIDQIGVHVAAIQALSEFFDEIEKALAEAVKRKGNHA